MSDDAISATCRAWLETRSVPFVRRSELARRMKELRPFSKAIDSKRAPGFRRPPGPAYKLARRAVTGERSSDPLCDGATKAARV